MTNAIRLKQVKENNLKNIDVEIPYYKHTVIAGVSGSGKSTLAYDVIYASAQRKLLDCMSDQEKIFSPKMKQPKAGSIEGLSTVISLKQIKPNHNPRSTIGTYTNIGSFVRNLMAMHGQCRCLCCNKTFAQSSVPALAKDIEALPPQTVVEVSFPYFFTERSERAQQIEALRQKGYRYIYIENEKFRLRDFIEINSDIEFVLVVEGSFQANITLNKSDVNCLKNASRHGDKYLSIRLSGADSERIQNFYGKHGCPKHHLMAAAMEASDFSYNDISCACTECTGSGIKKTIHPSKVIKNPQKTLQQGPFFPDIYSMSHPYSYMSLYSLACHYGFPFDAPYEELSEEAKKLILYGSGEEKFLLQRPEGYGKALPNYLAKEGKLIHFQGILTRIEELYQDMRNAPETPTPAQEHFFKTYMHEEECPSCGGTRLKKIKNYITLNGKNYAQLGRMEFSELLEFSRQIVGNEVSQPIVDALRERLALMAEIGLDYLCFARRIDTLSGGEYQRLRIASQVGSGLVGLTYIIDEPTDGLHGTDNQKIIHIIHKLLEKGNTVITIEHDIDVISAADYIIELGPGAGVDGGEIIAAGSPQQLRENPDSLIGKYLSGKSEYVFQAEMPERISPEKISQNISADKIQKVSADKVAGNRPSATTQKTSSIKIFGIEANNIKNADIEIPLHKITCFTGVSGSGKSSIVYQVLYKAFCSRLQNSHMVPGKYRAIEGFDRVKNIICIDQSLQNGKSTSIPATYLDLFDAIRTLFSQSIADGSEMKDKKAYFSFNSKGACPACKGKGYIEKYIQYFGETRIVCSECGGQQYIDEVLSVKYQGKNIKQVLDMTFSEASVFFAQQKNIQEKIMLVCDLGLGYMQLGQPFNTLSGGEAQRMKLAKQMSRCKNKKDLLYIFDEPTIGLHAKDVSRIREVMQRIIEAQNTIVLVEHHPDMILSSDYIIDLGPGAGKHGGNVVFSGTPSQLLACGDSKTAEYLRRKV